MKEEDKWILTKYENTILSVKKFMDKYEFNNAGAMLYEFVWNYFCDSYIEMSKFSSDCISTKSTLCFILTGILKMLQPFMPFVTDEIYSMLPIKDAEDIMVSSYPSYDKKLVFSDCEKEFDNKVEFIKIFRNIKAENNITKDLKVLFDTTENLDIIIKMLKLENSIIESPLDIKSYKVISKNIKATIYFEKKETEEEKALKENQIKLLKDSIERREKLLSNENYVNKAPANIVENDRQKLEEEKKKLEELLK